jgi:hypothetical protein
MDALLEPELADLNVGQDATIDAEDGVGHRRHQERNHHFHRATPHSKSPADCEAPGW